MFIGAFMTKIVECIPNFSEGRRSGVLGALAAAAGVAGAALLDYSADPDHNRSVYTLIGSPEGVAEAAFQMCKVARDEIDMNAHEGAHPRMGAADVVPFVPIKNFSMDECVGLSVAAAARIYGELGIPCFLYENSCASESRRNLADIRRGGFEGMPAKLLQEGWAPDFGGREIHPTAGVTAVGARMPLIAFNVNLGTPDARIAKKIAKAIRGSNGGFKYCKAIGLELAGRGISQVSMNMVNYEGTRLHEAYEAVRELAGRYGAPVLGSEILGVAPAKALSDCAEFYLKLENFDYKSQVMENRLLDVLDTDKQEVTANAAG